MRSRYSQYGNSVNDRSCSAFGQVLMEGASNPFLYIGDSMAVMILLGLFVSYCEDRNWRMPNHTFGDAPHQNAVNTASTFGPHHD